jgi:hypothetical protein
LLRGCFSFGRARHHGGPTPPPTAARALGPYPPPRFLRTASPTPTRAPRPLAQRDVVT